MTEQYSDDVVLTSEVGGINFDGETLSDSSDSEVHLAAVHWEEGQWQSKGEGQSQGFHDPTAEADKNLQGLSQGHSVSTDEAESSDSEVHLAVVHWDEGQWQRKGEGQSQGFHVRTAEGGKNLQGLSQGHSISTDEADSNLKGHSQSTIALASEEDRNLQGQIERTLTYKRRNASYSDAIENTDVIKDQEENDGIITPVTQSAKIVTSDGASKSPRNFNKDGIITRAPEVDDDDVIILTSPGHDDDVITEEPVVRRSKRRKPSLWMRQKREEWLEKERRKARINNCCAWTKACCLMTCCCGMACLDICAH